MLFGVGMIVGPSIGGVLFEYGGFWCPFFVVGITTFAASLFSCLCLPKPSESDSCLPHANYKNALPESRSAAEEREKGVSPGSDHEVGCLRQHPDHIYEFHKRRVQRCHPGTPLERRKDACLPDAIISKSNHFYASTQFTTMTPTSVGGMFLVSGVLYALTTQLWGILIERFGHAHLFVIAGYVFACLCLLLCGPMYPIPLKPSIAMVIVGQAMYGISSGPQLVGSFTEGLAETVRSGFPDDVTTSAAMSSVYQSACSLG